MIITESLKEFISLQRTGYGDSDIGSCYSNDIQKDYDSIKNYLPKSCDNIIDIGCGVGGIDLMLYNHYNGNVNLNMFDYSKKDNDIVYGYKHKTSAYNNLSYTKDFLEFNGVGESNINMHNVEDGFPIGKYDIIISLLSYGFHYPIETYLKQIKRCKSNIIILDIRKHSGQIERLKKHFKSVDVIAEWSKCERVLIK